MMSIVSNEEVLRLTRASLALPIPSNPGELLDDVLLSELLRRLAGFHCPCSPATLKRILFDTVEGLVIVTEDLNDRVDAVLDALHAGGDLLELARVTTRDEETRGTWVFAGPPSFVELPSGTVRIFGLASEEILPLPGSLRARVRAFGTGRVIDPIPGEDLCASLVNAGFREQSIDSWLRLPRMDTSGEYRKSMDLLLAAASPSGEIDQLRIFDRSRGNTYRQHWVNPTTQKGKYVGRRPQAHGADMWGYVELSDGLSQQFLDFPLPGSVHRGCDEAWRLQLALDAEVGCPQEFRLRPQGDGVAVDLFFPMPLWAQRRLDIVGQRIGPYHCLLSYWLPDRVSNEECAFLEKRLWMKKAIN